MIRRHHWFALLASIFALAGAGIGSIFLWAQYHLYAAEKDLQRYAFDDAQRHLDLCLKVRSGSAAIHLLAARTARQRDAYDEAERHLAECVRLGGTTEATILERRLLLAQQGELDEVEAPLRARTDADDPEAVTVLEALAKGYANRFWEDHALVCLNILLQRQPRHPGALLMRARAWENRVRKGQVEHESDALHDYEQLVELAPSFEARLGLAGTLYRLGRPWEALLGYEPLRAIQPENAELLLGLARCHYSLHELEEARRWFDELLEQHPRNVDALLERGRLEMHAGRLPEAEKWLRQAASLAPPYDCEAQRTLSLCLEAMHKTSEWRLCLDELRRREADVLEVQRLIRRGKSEPHNVALRYETAAALMRIGREREGVAALYFVLQEQPRHGPAQAALADYFERQGQLSRAARHRRLATVAPASGRTK